MIQIRIANFDGTDPVILEHAKGRQVSKVISSADEGVSFEIAKNDPKASGLNPDTTGYLKRWEAWDTQTNQRINYGPITQITESGPNWKVMGDGRSGLLGDFFKTKKTFYATINSIVDDLRYENLAIEPRTTTLVPSTTASAAQTEVFGTVTIDEKYHGLSVKTKDNAIDDDRGLFKAGEIEPPNTHHTTDSFWAGMSKADSHIVDLGDNYEVNKVSVSMPSWGGAQRYYNRSFDYSFAVAQEGTGADTLLQGRRFKPFE